MRNALGAFLVIARTSADVLKLREKIAFLVVGGSLSAGYLVLASTFYACGLPATISSGLAYSLLIPLGYFAQRGLAFRSTGRHGLALVRYVIVQGIALSIATATTFFVV